MNNSSQLTSNSLSITDDIVALKLRVALASPCGLPCHSYEADTVSQRGAYHESHSKAPVRRSERLKSALVGEPRSWSLAAAGLALDASSDASARAAAVAYLQAMTRDL